MSLETSMSSRHLLPGRRTRSCNRSIRTNHSSYRHWNWIHQNCHRRQSGFRLSCRSSNVRRVDTRVEPSCVPSASFYDHRMNCYRHRKTKSHHRTKIHHRMMSCFRHYCSNHLMSHTQRCSGGSSQPVRHSRQTPLLKER